MPNVAPGDIAYYVGSVRKDAGPQYGQFCRVIGAPHRVYHYAGCCGQHRVSLLYLPGEIIWEVEWCHPVVYAFTPILMAPLTLVRGPEADRSLRKLNGGVTPEEIIRQIELDKLLTGPKVPEREEVASGVQRWSWP